MPGRTMITLFFLIFLFFLVACQKRSGELDGQTFERLCRNNGDQWMEMEPIKDGKMLSVPKCFGCMIGENHFCSVEEYVDYINTLPSWMR